MDKQEFLLLIPAIIYGVAIVDLLKIFSHKRNYFEMVGWGIFVLIVVVFSWMELYQKLTLITSSNLSFFLIIGQAILYAQITNVITPEEGDKDTLTYFLKVKKLFFTLLAIAGVLGIIMRYTIYDDHSPEWIRPLAVALYIICAFSNSKWLRVSILITALILAVLRVFTDVLI